MNKKLREGCIKLRGLIAAAFAGIIFFGVMSTKNATDLGKQGAFQAKLA